MFNTPALNDLNFACVSELIYPQPALSTGGAQGVVATNPFYNSNMVRPAPVREREAPLAGEFEFDDLPDMIMAPNSIREPSWLPVGLNNSVGGDTSGGAGL